MMSADGLPGPRINAPHCRGGTKIGAQIWRRIATRVQHAHPWLGAGSLGASGLVSF